MITPVIRVAGVDDMGSITREYESRRKK